MQKLRLHIPTNTQLPTKALRVDSVHTTLTCAPSPRRKPYHAQRLTTSLKLRDKQREDVIAHPKINLLDARWHSNSLQGVMPRGAVSSIQNTVASPLALLSFSSPRKGISGISMTRSGTPLFGVTRDDVTPYQSSTNAIRQHYSIIIQRATQ